MKFVEKTAKTVDEAIKAALEELNLTMDQVKIEILEQPTKGIFGFIGTKQARVRVESKAVEEKAERLVKEKSAKEPTKETTRTEVSIDSSKEKDIAHKFLREVLDAMDIKAEIRVKQTNEGLYINLAGPKMGIIIGRRGQTLDSLQYLVSLVVNKDKNRDSYIKVILDTEDYRRKREETLNRLAKRLAERVVKTGKKVELEPMNPYERRIIHSSLQDFDEIVTYSEGEEPNRKVIIAHK